jgi:hypothetical protein
MTSSAKSMGMFSSPLAAIALKLVGGITILASILDFLILLVPLQLSDRSWLIATTTQVVDRGIVPLVGMALLFTGYWIESSLGITKRKNVLVDARLWTCLLASLLGLVFIGLTLLHPNTVRLQSKATLDQVSQEAAQAKTQLEQRLGQEVNQQRQQVQALLSNPDLLKQAVASGQVSQEQATQIEKFRNDPKGLETFLNQQAAQLKTRLETEIGTRGNEATKKVKLEATKAMIRISVSSLLLAIGFATIGWLGLQRLLFSGSN